MAPKDMMPLFKSIVKEVRNASNIPTPSHEILSHKIEISDFKKEAIIVNDVIAKLRSFVLENMKDYINTERYVFPGASKMTDTERDAIDMEVTSYARACKSRIDSLRVMINHDKFSPRGGSRAEHELGIVTYLIENLEAVTKMIEKQQAIRLERAIYANTRLSHSLINTKDDNAKKISLSKRRPEDDDFNQQNIGSEEFEMLQHENEALEERFQHDFDATREMQKKIVEVAQLLDQFTNTLVQQNQEIEEIHGNALNSTVTINQGNQHLIKAQEYESNCGFLMFSAMIFMSFILLILHWYI